MKRMIIFVMLSLLLLLAACQTQIVAPDEPKTDSSIGVSDTTSDESIKKFSSAQEIMDYLKDNQTYSFTSYAVSRAGGMAIDMVAEESAAAPMAKAMAVNDGGSQSAADFSTTNVQVEGVDEADFVKNDGKYIYVLSQDNLVIVDAYPAKDADILSKTEIEGYPQDIFINGDRLVVFSVVNDESLIIPEYDFVPRPRYTQATHAYIYDISDKEDPELMDDISIKGNYFQARMIGDYVYFIAKDNVYYYDNYIDMPVIKKDGSTLLSPEVFYFDNPEDNYVFHTVASFNIDDVEEIDAKSFMMGYSNTLYVSENNIYITYQKNLPYRYYEDERQDRFYDVVVPLLPADVKTEINSIRSSSLTDHEKWAKISSVLEEMYDSMGETEKENLLEDINDAIDEYEAKLASERAKTIIHRIAIDDGKIEHKAKGEVSGYLLNQFSLDENDGNLRVATTTNLWTSRKNVQYNNVYVLDEDMDIIGKLEEIAPDESIYSTRFVGDRLYMVTFKRIDPLFVVDLTDAENPKVLGKLKIPGYSDYLHPYDEDHIIGIGKETEDNQYGGTSIKGVKLALFDVSNVESPKLVDSFEIGSSGTDSEALREHKAFLFDKEKNILVIPVREVKEGRRYDRYQRVWQGAYVFGLTPEEGFELKGKISHNDYQEETRWYWNSPYAVKRSLYMDDVLYTISSKKIVMNDLDDIDEELNEVDLPYKVDSYPRPYPMIE